MKLKVIISGGGTGGHIYPAIAIANELKLRYPEANILFVGAKDRMEMQKVPEAGYPIKGLWISGLQRKITLKNLSFPLKVMSSLLASRRILRSFKPDIAIGTGGYASGPLLSAANNKGIPTLIQEQNSYPGITNKLLSKKANVICVAYDKLERFFPKDKIVKTGNPVRQDLLNVNKKRAEALKYFDLDTTRKTLLVLGGSLGAKKINEFVNDNLDFFKAEGVQLIWQTGKLYYEQYKHKASGNAIQVKAYINQMDMAYAAADVILSRSGASSVSELCIVGKPTIFVPSPNVAEDHQTKNAQAIVDEEAAILIKEENLYRTFNTVFKDLLSDKEKQEDLSRNITKLALVNATKDIVDEIEKLIAS